MSTIDGGGQHGYDYRMPTTDDVSRFIHIEIDPNGVRAMVRSPDFVFLVQRGTDDLPTYDANNEVLGFGNEHYCVVRRELDDAENVGHDPILEIFDYDHTGYLGCLAFIAYTISQMT